MKIKAVVFDLDGTLSNTLASIAGFANGALVRHGLPAIEEDRYRTLVGEGRDKLIQRMIEHSYGRFDEALYQAVGEDYDRLYADDPMQNVTVYPHIGELLEGLARRGIPCAVLSNKPEDMTRAVVAGLFPAGTFRVVHGQRPGVPRKPAPDAVLAILREMQVSPAECLYVGDTKTDMQTAKNAGAVAAGVLWGFRDEAELRAYHADFIAADPLELLAFIDTSR